MRRLFWMGVGAAGTVLAARRLQAAWHRYTPEGVADQVEQAGHGAVAAVHGAVDTFRTARAERERDLTQTLLVSPDGGDAGAVFRRRDGGPTPDRTPTRSSAVPSGRVDDDEPLYDF